MLMCRAMSKHWIDIIKFSFFLDENTNWISCHTVFNTILSPCDHLLHTNTYDYLYEWTSTKKLSKCLWLRIKCYQVIIVGLGLHNHHLIWNLQEHNNYVLGQSPSGFNLVVVLIIGCLQPLIATFFESEPFLSSKNLWRSFDLHWLLGELLHYLLECRDTLYASVTTKFCLLLSQHKRSDFDTNWDLFQQKSPQDINL